MLTLSSGSQIEIRETPGASSSIGNKAGAASTWAVLLQAALVGKQNGRSAFYQSIHGNARSPGWTSRTPDPEKLVDLFLQKVEWLSRRGKMADQAEVLEALTPAQRAQHMVPPEEPSTKKKSPPDTVEEGRGAAREGQVLRMQQLARARVSSGSGSRGAS